MVNKNKSKSKDYDKKELIKNDIKIRNVNIVEYQLFMLYLHLFILCFSKIVSTLIKLHIL